MSKYRYHLILDPSAFASGIGTIKQWATNEECELYIPYYTLKELDFLKKGNSLFAVNARESVRFVDHSISGSDYNSFTEADSVSQKIKASFILEGPDDAGPEWKRALGYKRRTPAVSEFPKKILGPGVFGSVYPGYSQYVDQVINRDNVFNPNAENDTNTKVISPAAASEEDYLKEHEDLSMSKKDDGLDQDRAYVPRRLKDMIRSCIQKVFVENKNARASSKKRTRWIIVCEDQSTTIWLTCFGLEVKHINQVQAMMNADAGLDNRTLFVPKNETSSSGDSSSSAYEVVTERKNRTRRTKTRRASEFKDDLKENFEDISELNRGLTNDLVISSHAGPKKESIDTITYAPRGKGQLWRPGS